MGGKIERFEDLQVFKCARELTNNIFLISENYKVFKSFSLREQTRRAAISIISNIAEGFERKSKAEFIQFLYTAKGSSGELRAQLMIANDQKFITADVYNDLNDKCMKVSSMLSNLIKYLKKEKERFGN